MKLYRWLLPAALILGFVLLGGCKKKEDEESNESELEMRPEG